jgi:hypothetical protein
MKISGTYKPTKWEEEQYGTSLASTKATKVSAEFAFSGDIEGSANVQYLMFYKSFDPNDAHNAKAEYVGLLRIEGMLKGQAGSFVLTDRGKYENGVALSKIEIIQGSGTENLSNVKGNGSYKADQTGSVWELEVTF